MSRLSGLYVTLHPRGKDFALIPYGKPRSAGAKAPTDQAAAFAALCKAEGVPDWCVPALMEEEKARQRAVAARARAEAEARVKQARERARAKRKAERDGKP